MVVRHNFFFLILLNWEEVLALMYLYLSCTKGYRKFN